MNNKRSVGQTFLSADENNIKITRRRFPHLQVKGATYFVTFRTRYTRLSSEEQQCILDHLVGDNNRFYTLISAVVMPDHVHLLIIPFKRYSLSRIMKGIKGVSARKINKMRQTTGSIWQDESFDRIIRNQKELNEKLQYMANNPVKEGLTDDIWNYPGWYFNRKEEID